MEEMPHAAHAGGADVRRPSSPPFWGRRPKGRRGTMPRRQSLRGLEVDSAGAAVASGFELVLNALVLLQRHHAGAFDRADMDEGVVAAIFGADETIALIVVEEFYGAGDGHW